MTSVCLIIKTPGCGPIPAVVQMEFLDQRARGRVPTFLSQRQETCEEVVVPSGPFEPTNKNTKIVPFKWLLLQENTLMCLVSFTVWTLRLWGRPQNSVPRPAASPFNKTLKSKEEKSGPAPIPSPLPPPFTSPLPEDSSEVSARILYLKELRPNEMKSPAKKVQKKADLQGENTNQVPGLEGLGVTLIAEFNRRGRSRQKPS